MAEEGYGIMLWHPISPDSDVDCLVDIVFLHGLNGAIGSTFTHRSRGFGSRRSVIWPRDLLKDDLEVDGQSQARIMGFGFDADVFSFFGRTGHQTISSIANTFLAALANVRRADYQRERPLILFGHSLGGLIIKRALSKAWDEDDPSLGDVFRRRRLIALSTRAIIFAGTPHRGSARAGLAAWGTSWLGAFGAETTPGNVNDLQEGSNTTEMLREEFQKVRRRIRASRVSMTPPRPDITIYTFCEGIPMPVVGIIVTRESAEIDGNNEIVSSISGRDHRTMVKFASRNENGYREYLGAIRDVIDEVRREMEAGVRYVTDEERLGRESGMERNTSCRASLPQSSVSVTSEQQGVRVPRIDQGTAPEHQISQQFETHFGPSNGVMQVGNATVSNGNTAGAYNIHAVQYNYFTQKSRQTIHSSHSVSPAPVSPDHPHDHTRPGLDKTSQEIEEILAAANHCRSNAEHRSDTQHAITLFRQALDKSEKSHKPKIRHRTYANLGIVDCYCDLSENKSSSNQEKLDFIRKARRPCAAVMQLAKEAGLPGQERRSRIYSARLDAQEILLNYESCLGKSSQRLQSDKEGVEDRLRNLLSELERDVNRNHDLWRLVEEKISQLRNIQTS